MSKHKRKGRSIDHLWTFIKYKYDVSIYAHCSCGFRYSCCKNIAENPGLKIVIAPEKLYPYCPWCGARKKRYDEEVKRVDYSWWEE